MKEYEYIIRTPSTGNQELFEQYLNEKGEIGWELCGVHRDKFIFKRALLTNFYSEMQQEPSFCKSQEEKYKVKIPPNGGLTVTKPVL